MIKEISKQLAKCPFCGETLRKIGSKRRDNQFYVHNLNGPDCILKEFAFKTDDEEKIKRWNTRKPMERIVERLEELLDKTREENSQEWNSHYRTANIGKCVGLRDAIEIVKEEGGMK